MLIKLLLLVAVLVVAILSLRAPAGARHLALRRVAVFGFGLLAVASILFPDAWNRVAAAVGVGRGTDLLLYGLIVVFLGYMVTTYRRFRGMESQITELARRLAVDEALGDLEHAAPALPRDPGTATPVVPVTTPTTGAAVPEESPGRDT